MQQFAILTKYWQPGAVKTRLAASTGDQIAAQLHRMFVRTLSHRMRGIADRCVLVCTQADRSQEFVELAGVPWSVEPQCDGDLGQRLEHHLHRALDSGVQRAVLIGADSPTLPIAYVEEAFSRLAQHDVVLGPATDGGYYLLGVSRSVPPIFQGVSWGTEHVWSETRERLQNAGVSWAALPEWYDVDDLQGLLRLHAEFQQAPPADPIEQSLAEAVRHAVSLTDTERTE